MSWLWVLNTKLTSCRYVSPGHSTTDGKLGWLMLSGKACKRWACGSAISVCLACRDHKIGKQRHEQEARVNVLSGSSTDLGFQS